MNRDLVYRTKSLFFYLILDKKECYHIGASLNHAGQRVFRVDRIEDPDVVATLIQKGSQCVI